MGKTESIFAGILVVAIVLAVVLVLFRNDGGASPIGPGGDSYAGSPTSSSGYVAFTGNDEQDLCTCYEQAYAYGNSPRSIESLEYKGGFSACSQRLGRDGGNAWTWGWANGQQAPSTPRTCRGYYATLRNGSR